MSTTTGNGKNAGPPVLKDAFGDRCRVGVALSLDQIAGNDPDAIGVVEKHFNSITPENILKWEEVHPQPGRYEFGPADRYVAFGEKHGMQIVGHTLVWHLQTPDWVFRDESGMPLGRDALLRRMEDHITTVVGRYRGRIHGWDVVNEAVDADGRIRKSKWLEIIGEDYIAQAFTFARRADPGAELYYNEFDYEIKPKCAGVIRLIRDLQSGGVRVDGIGIQGHWFLDYPAIEEIEASIASLSSTGVPLMVTEMDVSALPYYPVDSSLVDLSSFNAETQKRLNPYPDALPDAVQRDLARRYAQLFLVIHRHMGKISRVTFWAVHDGQSWRNYSPIRGKTDYPMLFDRRCRPKPAFDAVIAALHNNT